MTDLPLTRQHVPDLAPPTIEAVNQRFSDGTIPHRAVRDLARYESERARLATLAPPRATSAPLPADDTRLVLSPAICLLMYGADLPAMLAALRAGKPATPRPARGWILLRAAGGGRVEERELDREGGWVFEWFRDPTTIGEALAMLEERAPIEALWKQGLLVEAP